MNNSVLFILLLMFCSLILSCKSHKDLTTKSVYTDSIKVLYQERIEYVSDTLFVEIPHQVSEVVSIDSVSRLENDYALSFAWFLNGQLHHTLETKPQKLSVIYSRPITTITSSSEHKEQNSEAETITEYIERELTWWQKTRIYGFYGLFALMVLLYTIKRFRTHIQ